MLDHFIQRQGFHLFPLLRVLRQIGQVGLRTQQLLRRQCDYCRVMVLRNEFVRISSRLKKWVFRSFPSCTSHLISFQSPLRTVRMHFGAEYSIKRLPDRIRFSKENRFHAESFHGIRALNPRQIAEGCQHVKQIDISGRSFARRNPQCCRSLAELIRILTWVGVSSLSTLISTHRFDPFHRQMATSVGLESHHQPASQHHHRRAKDDDQPGVKRTGKRSK